MQLVFLVFFSIFAQADLSLVLETGTVWQTRNDVQIPPDMGSALEIDHFDSGPFFHGRSEVIWKVKGPHYIKAVYAPFSINLSGSIEQNIEFNGETFLAGQDLDVSYTFNSYRLTYFYAFPSREVGELSLGITAKIRDAEIKYSQPSRRSFYDNIGLVPLIYFEWRKPMARDWLFLFNVDFAAAPQGRAIDAAFKFRRQISNKSQIGLGYRTLEGGADNDKVKTFSWFHYALIDYKITF